MDHTTDEEFIERVREVAPKDEAPAVHDGRKRRGRSGLAGAGVFKEAGRIEVGNVDIVVSVIYQDDKPVGVTVNTYVKTERYEGFKRGAMIGVDHWQEFKTIVNEIGF